MWEELLFQAIVTLLPLLALLIIALISLGIAYLRKHTQRISNEVAQTSLLAALAEAESQAMKAVKATNQTLVDELKAGRADGKLTEEEKRKALEAAKIAFMRGISSGSLKTLEAAIGPVEQWLTDLIEAKVAEAKDTSETVRAVDKLANPLSSNPAS